MPQSDSLLIIDEEFKAILSEDSTLECVSTGYLFTEGPVWLPAQNCLLFSDIPADRIYRWSEADGPSIWREPSHNSNGNTLDLDDNLLTCEHGSRTVTRTVFDGEVQTLATHFAGIILNSPNDIVTKSDGTLWFTDPPYGITPEQIEQPHNYVFRLDPGATEPVAVVSDFNMPNGLCFSPDEKILYIADSSSIAHIRRFEVNTDNTLSGGEVFCTIDSGVPDGIRCDTAGRIFSTAADGVQVFAPDGRLLGKILTPETAANCTFGGEDFDTLYITATSCIHRIKLNTQGIKPVKKPE